MKQSQLFSKTLREAPRDEESVNAKLLIKAGFIDKVMAGVYSFLPLGFKVLKNIEGVIRKEMISLGAEEILMPTLQPKANWIETGRWSAYDTLFKFTSFYSKNEYALGPTHEEIVSPLAKKFIVSYRDLPKAVFQIQNKFRDEKRAKAGLLRGREFFMKDLYSFHKDEGDLDRYYEKAKKAYEKIYRAFGLDKYTYLTFASGGTFSKYSHEYQTLTPAGEDLIHVCSKCHVAINEEIINEQSSCPKCGSKNLKSEKAVEVGNIFKLKNKYSAPFSLKYKDERGKEEDVVMGCYGIGLNRLLGTIVEIYHDDKGIIWPESVAPFKVHLLRLGEPKSKAGKFADKAYKELLAEDIEVLYDDRDLSAGEKFADADLIGIPWRLVVSEKTGDKIEVKKRNEDKTKLMNYGSLRQIL